MKKTSRPSQQCLLPIDLLIQIFIRLPIKQLLKCLFISKFWCSIIRHPTFIKVYHKHNPFCLLLSIPYSLDNIEYHELPHHRHIYCSNIVPSGQQEFFNLFNLPLFDNKKRGGSNFTGFYGVTQMINGLFCSYLGNLVSLVNVFTGQVTRFPCPNIPPKSFTHCYLGFESTTGLYKLLCIYELSLHNLHVPEEIAIRQFHILNIRASDQEFSWKLLRLPEENSSHFNLNSESISINGSLYWIQNPLQNFLSHKFKISCFDLSTEKFTYFTIDLDDLPKQPRLVQFTGKLSLFYCIDGDMIIRILEMDESSRVLHKAILPSELQGTATPIGNLSRNQIVLVNSRTINGLFTPVYIYKHGTNHFERFVVGKFPPFLDLENRDDIGKVISCVEQTTQILEALIHRYSLL